MSAKFASRKNPEQRSVDSSLTLSEGRGGDGVRTERRKQRFWRHGKAPETPKPKTPPRSARLRVLAARSVVVWLFGAFMLGKVQLTAFCCPIQDTRQGRKAVAVKTTPYS